MTSPEPLIGRYWGKARPSGGDGPSWHPLAYHSLDVAAVMGALLAIRPAWLTSVARQAGLPIEEARKRLILVAALHDLGKFAENFQWKVADLFAGLQPDADPALTNPRGHGDVGHAFWSRLLDRRDDTALDRLEPWLLAAVAHHGAPTDGEVILASAMSPAAFTAAETFTDAVLGLIGQPDPAMRAAKPETWRVAGLVMLADWIGSNQRWFPYQEPDLQLADYWRGARAAAETAVREADLAEAPPASLFDLTGLLGDGARPSPLQAWATAETVPTEPTLYLIEDLTGSGKTEAALILAHRLMAAGQAEGLYWALPTMATANGLYRRLEGRYQSLFETGGAAPSLVLAHGGRDLNTAFQASISDGVADAYGDGRGEQNQSGESHCAAFIAEDRKKTFLGQVGVGTLDQALLSVLPVRHQAVRLAALSRRVLIVDEAHAYDPYMTAALERLLRFQAAFGGSAIVLSATLTTAQRRLFAKAYTGKSVEVSSAAFPLVTRVAGSAIVEAPQPSDRGTRRDLAVRRQASPEAAMDALLAAAVDGRCGVYVRNTVKDALEAVDYLRSRAPETVRVDLFHARFALGDRLARETDALARFGVASTSDQRRGRILVATQVVEQSLDLDFDHMATDLCPMDLLIQRAGRLHRHGHRPRRPDPVLDVVAPEASDAATADWYSAMFPTGQFVYPDVGQLWRTQRLLDTHGGLPLKSRSPRDLIEPVFGDHALVIPEPLIGASDRAFGKDVAARAIGFQNVLETSKFFRGAAAWDSDIRTPTRLGEPSVIVRLARWDGVTLRPWCDDPDPYRAWRLSELTLRASQFAAAVMPSEDCARAVDAARASWPGRFEGPQVVVLSKMKISSTWRGEISKKSGQKVSVTYSKIEGLRL